MSILQILNYHCPLPIKVFNIVYKFKAYLITNLKKKNLEILTDIEEVIEV